MVKRKVSCDDQEPDNQNFEKPSEGEHLFIVDEVFDSIDNIHPAINLDNDTVCVKLVVNGGDEEGRSLLHRLSLDTSWKGFFATRLFLKAIGEPYKGNIEIDTSRWTFKQFFATVVHSPDKIDKNKVYANISTFNFEKSVEKKHIDDGKNDASAWDE